MEVIEVTEREVEVIEVIERGPAGPTGATGPQGPAGAGGVTSVTGTAPIVSSGGTTPAISVTVGTTANTVCAGDDARLSDARTPSSTLAHASTHHTGSTDAIAPNNISAAWAEVTTSQTISADTLLSAGRNRRINLTVTAFTPNIDLPYDNNAAGDVVTLVTFNFQAAISATVRGASAMSGGTPSSYATLVTFTAVGQSYTFVSDGTATGWSQRNPTTHTHTAAQISDSSSIGRTVLTAADAVTARNAIFAAANPHTHAADAITSGTLDNARINFAAPSSIGNTTRNSGAFTTLSSNVGTITASTPLAVTQTWNNSATNFRAIETSITNTASQTESFHLACSVSGSLVAYIRRDGRIVASANVYGSTGLESALLPQGVAVGSASYIGFCSNSFANDAGGDLRLFRDAANTLGQRNGTNPQTFRLYNTFTDTNNYERGFLRWSSNVFQIGTEKAGTGSARALEFQTDGTTRLTITTGGSVIHAISDGVLGWSGSTIMRPTSGNGTLRLSNAAQTDFNRLQFGGTDNTFPALKRSSTALQVRLADDSAFAPLSCGTFSHTGNLGFYGTTAIAQPASVGTAATGYTANGPTNTVHADSTFTGNVGATAYTISDIVKHLKTLGLIAS